MGYHFLSAHPPVGGKVEAGYLTQVLIAICVALTQSFKASSAKWGPELFPHTLVC